MGLNYQHWDGFKDLRFGYGRHTRGYIEHVPDNVRFNPKASVNVYMGIPEEQKGWFEGQHKVLHTMWETSELPPTFSRYLPLYDQIIVPCEHNRQVFAKHHSNVSVVPEGVDRNLFKPRKVARHEKFQFRAGGSLWMRKGLDVIVKAFNTLNLPDAELRVKPAPHAYDVPDGFLGDRIYLDRAWMSEEEQLQWFAEADCFVAVSRGEGWGLMPMQTISMAVPTILSESSGHFEFIDLATATVKCGTSPAPPIGVWDEPDVDDLCEKMLWVYENRVEARKIARAKASGVGRFSWENASRALLDVLPVGTLLKNPQWMEASVGLWVVALRTIKADIGSAQIRQRAGDKFKVTLGQYQVLYDSGAIGLPS